MPSRGATTIRSRAGRGRQLEPSAGLRRTANGMHADPRTVTGATRIAATDHSSLATAFTGRLQGVIVEGRRRCLQPRHRSLGVGYGSTICPSHRLCDVAGSLARVADSVKRRRGGAAILNSTTIDRGLGGCGGLQRIKLVVNPRKSA